MELDKLYGRKGELVTQIEIAQAQLQDINKQIVDEINKQNAPKSVDIKSNR